jgi:glycosyltransferase involved in cell wall biosynthesis
VVFNSQAMQRLFEHSIVSLGDGAEILHPPIEIPLVQQRARSGNLLYVGRFFEQKGVNDAIRVAAALPGRRLDLYGSGRGDADARSLAQKSGVNACFHPWGSADVVAQAMASAACLLVPTRMFEAWGMVGPEAIAQGCPVVAYDAGGVREWLAPEYGEVVPQGNLIAMVEAVRRQLARCEAGLDTSGWRKAVDNCWGLTAFSENYTRLIHALP